MMAFIPPLKAGMLSEAILYLSKSNLERQTDENVRQTYTDPLIPFKVKYNFEITRGRHVPSNVYLGFNKKEKRNQ